MAVTALVMVVIKILLEMFLFIIKKINQRKILSLISEGAYCKFLKKKNGINVCTNRLFYRKMKNGLCPRQKCGGFTTGDTEMDDNIEVINHPLFLVLKKTVDLFPEFAAALLALNEILIK